MGIGMSRKQNYYLAIDEKIMRYNCVVMVNQIRHRSKREITNIDV